MKNNVSRRDFIRNSLVVAVGASAVQSTSLWAMPKKSEMRMGLVTYQWGKDWDLPTLIDNCERIGFAAVELRTEHAHGVETTLNASQRREVKERFADSPVTCVGYGSNFEYHSPDQKELRRNIEQTKEYIKLCKDIGATGIKVKPNTLPTEVPEEKTISQIAASLNEVGSFAKDYGQLVRVEVHGALTSELSVMKAIFEQVTENNVKICWNSNTQDLEPPGIEENFNMVKQWIGDTTHIRGFQVDDYPYEKLFGFLDDISYNGFILLEASHEVPDRITAMKEQLALFNELVGHV